MASHFPLDETIKSGISDQRRLYQQCHHDPNLFRLNVRLNKKKVLTQI
jgi:hypothetical protein